MPSALAASLPLFKVRKIPTPLRSSDQTTMESDGLAIHRFSSGNFDRNYWRRSDHHRVVPIRTIAGRSAATWVSPSRQSMTRFEHPVDRGPADAQGLSDSRGPDALRLHFAHLCGIYRGAPAFVDSGRLRLRVPSSWRSRHRFVSNSANTPSISDAVSPTIGARVIVSVEFTRARRNTVSYCGDGASNAPHPIPFDDSAGGLFVRPTGVRGPSHRPSLGERAALEDRICRCRSSLLAMRRDSVGPSL